jgi:glycosyltransferase involved in cell wall biosynthesis
MACGRAVVGSRVGGTPELVGEDERGLLFRSGDEEDLAAKLTALIENEALRRTLGARAAEFARRKLSVEIAAGRMAEIYSRVLRQKLSQ